MTAEVVPFGKYKGQPVEILAADRDYCEWLTTQPWFADKYRNVYNIVINYGAEPADSPEHNQMQARFLNDGWCLALANLIWPSAFGIEAAQTVMQSCQMYREFHECFESKPELPAICDRNFEVGGWDVVYSVAPASIQINRTRLVPPLPTCTCRCDHIDCYEDASCQGGKRYCRHSSCHDQRSINGHHLEGDFARYLNVDARDHCTEGCYWKDLDYKKKQWLTDKSHWYQPNGVTLYVELKSDLGDDYPSVLRQIKGYTCESYQLKRCAVVRRHAFQHVTWENVQDIFAASDIHLITEDSISA